MLKAKLMLLKLFTYKVVLSSVSTVKRVYRARWTCARRCVYCINVAITSLQYLIKIGTQLTKFLDVVHG